MESDETQEQRSENMGMSSMSEVHNQSPIANFASSALPVTLSDRELEVLFGIADGQSNREIAEQMRIGIKTVESYRARLVAKLHLRTRPELAQYANEHFQDRKRTLSE